MNRREARKQAFLLLFQYKFRPDETEALIEYLFETENVGEQKDYIKNTVLGTVENIEEIDRSLNEVSVDWNTDRFSSVILAALRLGAYEILYSDDVPDVVAVNEAVNIAKEYDGEEAAPFVNGILDKIKNKK